MQSARGSKADDDGKAPNPLLCSVSCFILLSAKSDFNAPVLSAVRLTVQTAVSPPAEGISEPFLRWVCRVCPRAEASRAYGGLG